MDITGASRDIFVMGCQWFLMRAGEILVIQLIKIIDIFVMVLKFGTHVLYNEGALYYEKYGGGGGNWTPVRKWSALRRYILSLCFNVDCEASTNKIFSIPPQSLF